MAEPGITASVSLSSILGKLPCFDGKTKVSKFLKTIATRAKLEGWSEERQTDIIKCLCTDLALSFLEARPELETASFAILTTALTDRFGAKVSRQEAYTSLNNLKQGSSSINEFAGSIEDMGSTVFDIITELNTPETRDGLLISVFINGLRQDIRQMIGLQEFKTLFECVTAATKAEKLLPPTKPRTVGAVETNPSPAAQPATPSRSYKQSSHRSSHHRDYRHSNRPHPYSKTPQFEVCCWDCGKFGHIRRFCPTAAPPALSVIDLSRPPPPLLPNRSDRHSKN